MLIRHANVCTVAFSASIFLCVCKGVVSWTNFSAESVFQFWRALFSFYPKCQMAKHENNLRANEVNIKQTGSWECVSCWICISLCVHTLSNKMHILITPFASLLWCLVPSARSQFVYMRVLLLHTCLTDLFLLPLGEQLESLPVTKKKKKGKGTKDGRLPSW